ncbi:MAG: 23S rRNA (pseudouridine(1915)-N(3))-methyltransferase RlmH [Gammaproteobacteria bacterium]|nr:23S rRNA (pseudouridine(1915)-N(3))-methyltransferase RlmH [Gammaproteobacteria bacterium]MDE2346622.1 23S rRNA (pseudouridine(1915)-N(3))-methyltransferase RlmH [Gammaproteobacteria bacterium]
MQILLLAAGTRQPEWVNAGFNAYAIRLPHECRLTLKEIPLSAKRRNNEAGKAVIDEGQRMLAAAPTGANLVALDVRGKSMNTENLAKQLQGWLQAGRDLVLMIGGPDGLSEECLVRAGFCWSLSPLTLPHGMVRIIVAEQLYRAWTVLAGHPYHRA